MTQITLGTATAIASQESEYSNWDSNQECYECDVWTKYKERKNLNLKETDCLELRSIMKGQYMK
jgi:hypothetical protein